MDVCHFQQSWTYFIFNNNTRPLRLGDEQEATELHAHLISLLLVFLHTTLACYFLPFLCFSSLSPNPLTRHYLSSLHLQWLFWHDVCATQLTEFNSDCVSSRTSHHTHCSLHFCVRLMATPVAASIGWNIHVTDISLYPRWNRIFVRINLN